MTNFAQPVSMPCTEEQYNRDLKEGLRGLGYKMNIVFANNMFYIGTNFDYQNNEGGSMHYSSIHERNRHYIPEYNPELFLAIAGMREGEDLYYGEYFISIGDTGIESSPIRCINQTPAIKNPKFWRKATLSELINHFKKEKMEKEHGFKFGDKVLCWDDKEKKNAIYFMNIGGSRPYVVITESELEDLQRGIRSVIHAFKHISSDRPPLKITRSEIAEWKGTDNFEIV